MNSTQLLKAYGHLPSIGLDKLADNEATQIAQAIDSAILNRACGCPDAPDEEIASKYAPSTAVYLDMPEEEAEHLITMHQAMLHATGRGSFPADCHSDLEQYAGYHAIKYYVDYESFPQHYKYALERAELESLADNGTWPWNLEQLLDHWLGKPMLDLALHIAEETYRRVGCAMVRVMDHDEDHNIHCRSRYISGSTIGLGWFNNGTCGSHVEAHIDSSWQPDLDRCSLLLNHEFGHNHALPHTFSNQNRHRGVMSYNWPDHTYGYLNGDEGILPRDPSWAQLTRQYGGEEIPVGAPPTQPPLKELDGELYVQGNTIQGAVTVDGVRYIAWRKSPISDRYVLREPPI